MALLLNLGATVVTAAVTSIDAHSMTSSTLLNFLLVRSMRQASGVAARWAEKQHTGQRQQ